MLRFAANLSLLFTEQPLLQRLAAARAAGFNAVEIQFPYDAVLPALQAARQQAGVELVLINVAAGDLLQGGPGLAAVPGKEAEFRAAVAEAVRYGQGLGVACINVLPGRLADGVSADAARLTLVSNLRYAAQALADAGIRCTCEAINHFDMPGFLINTASQLAELLAQVQHPNLAMQIDLYHMAREGEDLPALLAQYLPQIGHLQFADAPGRGAPGSGSLNWPALFTQIAQSSYQGWCAAEYRPGGDTVASLGWLAAAERIATETTSLYSRLSDNHADI